MPMLTLGDSTTVHQQDQLSVIGFPGLYGALYKNNKGTGQLTVTRTR